MYIALDIGGTKTLLAVFSPDGQVQESVKFLTPTDYGEFATALQAAADQLQNKTFEQGAIGVRGTVDRVHGTLVGDSILNWHDAPVVTDCQRVFSCEFQIENDSKLAGLSEARALDPIPHSVLYITISTGIGSALIIDGELEDAVINSELGLTLYEHDGRMQQWEDFASGKAIVAKYNKRASEIEDEATWQAITANWAAGFVNASAVYTPDVIVIGGGVGAHYQKFIGPLQAAIDALDHGGVTVPPIVGAKRAEEAVIYGCYELASHRTAQ